MKQEQNGRSMIEMLGVLAIIGVLSVGGIAGYSKAMMKFKINKTVEQISEIATNIRTLYAQQKNFNGLTNETAIQMGTIPDEITTSSNHNMGNYQGQLHQNAFGGDLFVYGYPDEWRDPEESFFVVSLTGLPKEACVALTTADWGTRDTSGIIGISIGDSSGAALIDNCPNHELDSYYSSCFTDFPISPTEAAQYCEKVVENSWSGISFGFAK